MARTQQALAFNTDPTSIVSHEYDVESGNCFKRHVITAVVNGTEHNIDPSDANNWHTPKNEREYLRSPQRAEWRTARAEDRVQLSCGGALGAPPASAPFKAGGEYHK